MATSEQFQSAVDELLDGSTNSAETMEEIIFLSTPPGISGIQAAPGTEDCTESLLGALRWGLGQYARDLYRGYGFFVALVRLGRMLPNTKVSNPSPVPCPK